MRSINRFFWGMLFILLGACLMLNHFLNWNIPVGTVITAFILIYLGIIIIFGKAPYKDRHADVFTNECIVSSSSDDEYNVIFGRKNVDLSSIALEDKIRVIKVDYIFSRGSIIINSEMPAIVRVDSAFAGARMPDGNSISFGDYKYCTKTYNAEMPHLEIKADALFSNLEIIEK